VSAEQVTPSAVFGLTVYNGEDHLAEALESLLVQTRCDFTVVVVDDCSTDRTEEISLRYAKLDPRVVYERNDRQLGLVRNWRRAFDLAGERFPGAPYFAWASDHDVWHPRWLEMLAAELDAHSEAVLAYPFGVRIDDFGAEYPTRERRFDTAGLAGRAERVRRAGREMTAAGEMIYGLARRAALERCGAFPLVVLPDRLHLARLAVEGEFRQVQRRLWYRRYRAGVVMSNARQRRAAFPDGAPLWVYLPWWLTHTFLFARSLAGDATRTRLAAVFLRESVRHAHERRRERVQRDRRWRRRERRRWYRGLARTALQRVGAFDVLRGHASHEIHPPDRAAEEQQAGDAKADTLRVSDALAALERADLLDDLAEPGTVVLEVGGGSSVDLGDQLKSRFPALVYAVVPREELGSAPLERIKLAVSIASLENLPEREVEACVGRLHELGVPALYSFERESTGLRAALGHSYWLRDVWVPSQRNEGRRERKPDPTAGPVPRPPGQYQHLVGRRRLIPGAPGTGWRLNRRPGRPIL
jgi:glycosyltransferase involved in cell wall biosynthesis